jgi:hypothetical protein
MEETKPLLSPTPETPTISPSGARSDCPTKESIRKHKRLPNSAFCLVGSLLVLLPSMLILWIWAPWHCGGIPTPRSIEDRVNRILSKTPLIGEYSLLGSVFEERLTRLEDGHNDMADVIRNAYNNRIYNPDFTEPFTHGGLTGHVDLERLSTGKVGGTFWSVWVPCPKDGMNFSTENYAESMCRMFTTVFTSLLALPENYQLSWLGHCSNVSSIHVSADERRLCSFQPLLHAWTKMRLVPTGRAFRE